MTHLSISRLCRIGLSVVVLVMAAVGCSGVQVAARPGWVGNPPANDGRYLYFTSGSGLRASESDARQAAVTSAVGEVPKYIGSHVESVIADFQVVQNGVDANHVEIAVKVVGTSVTIRGVTVLQTWCSRSSSGYDCDALIGYPSAEYARVMADIQAAETQYRTLQAQNAEYALKLYRDAAAFENGGDFVAAMAALENSAATLRTLQIPLMLQDVTLNNTGLLANAVSAAMNRVGPRLDDWKNRMAIRMVVEVDGARSDETERSLFSRTTAIAQKYGFKTSDGGITPEDASRCMAGDAAAARTMAGPSRYLLLVDADSLFSSERFGMEFYSKARGRWALVDTTTGGVLFSGDLSETRGSGVTRAGACADAVSRLWEGQLAGSLDRALAAVKR